MQFNYCPQCGNLDFKQGVDGPICTKCSYNGPLPEGSMDKINEVRKKARSSPIQASKPTLAQENSQSMKELAEKLKSLKGKSTNDVEFL